jgi:RimJ/RimL family protein N-acetyltransferase
MDKITFEIFETESITDTLAQQYVALLKEQGKVKAPNESRIKRCKIIAVATVESRIIGVGAIKKKTESDFDNNKANVPKLAEQFDWELGYCYTNKEFEGRGVSSFIVKNLLNTIGNINLMASTELFHRNSMIRILEKNGFRQIGTPWKSSIHDGLLGLFIRVKIGEIN